MTPERASARLDHAINRIVSAQIDLDAVDVNAVPGFDVREQIPALQSVRDALQRMYDAGPQAKWAGPTAAMLEINQ